MIRHDPVGRALLVQHSASRDGSAFSGLSLADGLQKAGWTVRVAFGCNGVMETVYGEHGHAVSYKNGPKRTKWGASRKRELEEFLLEK